MDVKELIRALSCFDKNLPVVIKDENWPHCETKEIAEITIGNYDSNGYDCIIETD